MLKRIVSSFLLILLLTIGTVSAFVSNGIAWSNGVYSSDPNNPDYGTHDWIAEHAANWLPSDEWQYIMSYRQEYLYGTELPDNGQAPDGIGDTTLHHVYFDVHGTLTDNSAAVRAAIEFNSTLISLMSKDYRNAAKSAGIMTHYIADMAVFGHVMGAHTDWGAETHHDDYEQEVNAHTSSYSSMFSSFLMFDGYLNELSAYDAALNLAYDTTFDNLTYTAVWMDRNYSWSNPTFVNRVGESLKLAVKYVTDVLHTLYVKSEAQIPPPFSWPSFPQVVIPLWTIGAAIALIALIVAVVVASSRPRQHRGKLVRLL